MESVIQIYAMLIMTRYKREKHWWNRNDISGRQHHTWRVGKLEVHRNVRSQRYQTNRDERLNKKRVLLKSKETSGNQTLQQESHQRNKHLGISFCNILGTILRRDENETQTNGANDKKFNDYAQAFIFET